MASASEIELSQAHEQLRRKTVKHRVGKLEGVGEDEGVDIGGVKDVAIDFLAGVVSGISGIVMGQVGVCVSEREGSSFAEGGCYNSRSTQMSLLRTHVCACFL